MQREPGYYWVRHQGHYLIAEFHPRDAWFFIGTGLEYLSEQLDWIDEPENRIPEPKEN